jgi:hypothetical protein
MILQYEGANNFFVTCNYVHCPMLLCVYLCPCLILMFDASMSMLNFYFVLVSMSNNYSMYLCNVYSIFVSMYMSNVDSMFMTMSMSNVFRVYCWNVCVYCLLLLSLESLLFLYFFFMSNEFDV